MEKVKVSFTGEVDMDKYQELSDLLRSMGIELSVCGDDCVVLPVALVCNIPEEREVFTRTLYLTLTAEESRVLKESTAAEQDLVKHILVSRIRNWLVTAEGVAANARSSWDFNWGDALQYMPMLGISSQAPVAPVSRVLPVVTLSVYHDELLAPDDVSAVWAFQTGDAGSLLQKVSVDFQHGQVWFSDGPESTQDDGLSKEAPEKPQCFVTLANGVRIPCDMSGRLDPDIKF